VNLLEIVFNAKSLGDSTFLGLILQTRLCLVCRIRYMCIAWEFSFYLSGFGCKKGTYHE